MSCGGGTDMQSGGARKKAKSSTKKTTNKLKELEFLEFQKGSNKPKRVMVDKKDVKAEKGTKKMV